jgi:hypothetical protein
MKTLKESILSSTKTGKEGISDLIEKWCKKHIEFSKDTYSFTKDNKIVNKDIYDIIVTDINENIPHYINFGKLRGNFILHDEAINYFNQEQLPEESYAFYIYINNDIEITKSFKYNVKNGFQISNEYSRKNIKNGIKIIEPIEINFPNKDYTYIKIENTKIDISSIQNIKSNNKSLFISGTSAALTLSHKVRMLEKNKDAFYKYMNETFKNMPNLNWINYGVGVHLKKYNEDGKIIWKLEK